jgi:hypothetical protein
LDKQQENDQMTIKWNNPIESYEIQTDNTQSHGSTQPDGGTKSLHFELPTILVPSTSIASHPTVCFNEVNLLY